MDKQTAIDLLDNLLGMVEDNHDSDYDTAIKMGIDALQSNAPNALSALDCVERQAAITAIQKAYADTEGGEDKLAVWKNVGLTNALHIMQDLPSAQPHEWIPVTERLPEDGREVWVTIKGNDVIRCEPGETIEQAIDRISKIRWVTRGYWSEEEHGWNDPSFGCPLMVQPIAWMPIDTPEPWRGGQDETN